MRAHWLQVQVSVTRASKVKPAHGPLLCSPKKKPPVAGGVHDEINRLCARPRVTVHYDSSDIAVFMDGESIFVNLANFQLDILTANPAKPDPSERLPHKTSTAGRKQLFGKTL